jgi:CRISPR-associated endonuclease/helicase Cas3
MGLHSHPHLLFREHIQQILSAMEGIFAWHTQNVATPDVRRLCGLLSRMHDLGKGTRAFQAYISNPAGYRGDRREKAHTPLSLLLILLIAERAEWDPLEALAVAASARGHHSGLPMMEDMRDIGGGDIAQLLKRQCPMLDRQALREETGIDVSDLLLDDRPWAKAKNYLDKNIKPIFDALPLERAVEQRLRTQFLFSVLLEADKAFLAVPDSKVHLERKRRIWEAVWVDERIGRPEFTPVNDVRQKARRALIGEIDKESTERIFSLTAPTGIGKTLMAATWALKERQRLADAAGIPPKIIIVLPFLSIIDQTAREYEALLRQGSEEPDGTWFLTVHSLSDRQYSDDMEEAAEAFFIDTWRTELVITTYDQFLLTLMSPKARYQMRFHNLCDALIVMDEVQSLPCKLWKPLESLLRGLTKMGNSRVLLMSATLPSFVAGVKPLLPNHEFYFKAFGRYTLSFQTREKIALQQFLDEIWRRLPTWLASQSRVLVTLNTRRSARSVRDALEARWPGGFQYVPLLFLSSDVTPSDRLKAIHQIAEGQPCIVVSTQCIEAGVDIDMDIVIRDFAPLDSLIQIAGRCNRGGNRERCVVEIVDIISKNGRRFSEMIYDPVHLQETWRIIEGLERVEEEQVLELANRYFVALSEKKNLGAEHLERFARWEEDEPIHTLLRGEEKDQVDFLVLEQDPALRKEMEAASKVEDRWQRREAWRKLAGRIARVSVNIYAKRGFNPEDIANHWQGHWILKKGYYEPGHGLLLPAAHNEGGVLIL